MTLAEQLVEGKLLRRYKRFLADVELSDGQVTVVHCPNPGSMLGVSEEGAKVLLRHSKSAARKLNYSWVLVGVDGCLVNVDTMLANKVIFHALSTQQLPPLAQYDLIEKERSFADSRFDFLLKDSQAVCPPCYLEVKSTTLKEGEAALFPDAVTARGRKHLLGLAQAVNQGFRAVQFFSIARSDVTHFRPAEHIDPAYARALLQAHRAGVELIAWTTEISFSAGRATFMLGKQVPVILSA